MERNTRKILEYIAERQRKEKQLDLIKLRKEVDIGATGTQRYRIKYGPNKGKVL
jgi:hypothetical protein